MTIEVEQFTHEFFQEIISESDGRGEFTEDIFFEKFCDHLIAAGEIESADRAAYRGPPGSGIRVDGYGGDPLDAEGGVLSLIISDFHQSQEIGRLTATDMNAMFRRLSKFLRKTFDPTWRNSLEETGSAFGLADLISQRWSRIDKVRLFLISNRELSERVDGREAEEFDGRTITYSVWDIRRLYRFVTSGHGREDIHIDLEKNFNGPIPLLPAQQSESGPDSYLAVVPGQVLASIYDRWGARLLEQNVRVFLQARSKVNKGIKRTLEVEPSMFFAYNNGITATAEEISIVRKNGGLLLRDLKNFQIVNGGQTTASIHVAHRSKLDLSQIFVQMKLSVINPDFVNTIVPKISEFANSQNRVNAADFFANHPFHIRMEGFSRRIFAPAPDGTFRESKWFYERARGQYADARSSLTPAQRRKFDLENPRRQVFSKTDLAKFQNVWEGTPHVVSLGAQKNFAHFALNIGKAWEKDPDFFSETWYRETVSKAIIFKETEKIVSEQPWYEGGYRANIVAYAIAKMAADVNEMNCAVDFQGVWQRQALSDPMEVALGKVAYAVHGVLVNPVHGISNVTEWAKKQACWAGVQRLEVEWPYKFVADLISAEEEQQGKKRAKKEQRELNGMEAQIAVTNAGAGFWKDVLEWGHKRKLIAESEMVVLSRAAQPGTVLSPRQSTKVLETLTGLQEEGFEADLPAGE